MRLSLLSLFLALAGTAFADRVLVLLESDEIKSTHSQVLKYLSSKGHDVDTRIVGDSSLKLKHIDDFLYEHLVILAPHAKSLGGSINLESVLDFVDQGHNVLVAGGKSPSSLIKDIAAGVGIKFDADGTEVVDHFSYASNLGNDHSVIASDAVFATPAVLGSHTLPGPVLFKGSALLVPRHAELVLKALVAPDTTYSAKPGEHLESSKRQLVAGQMATLVALMQARNNARVAVLGSLDLLSDKYIAASVTVAESGKVYKQSGNKIFGESILSWALQDRGVLRIKEIKHRIAAPDFRVEEGPAQYRISDDVVFDLYLEEKADGKWRPYLADDVQVEFLMLDPYIRQTLSPEPKLGALRAEFKVPDVYGVFKYVLKYARPGYSRVETELTVPVRPFRHNEYERFIPAAFPYYASSFSMMAGFFVFGFYYLYHV